MDLFLILKTAANAIAPIVLLIALGYCLRQAGLLQPAFLDTGNKLVFRLFLPCLLFANICDLQNLSMIPWDIVLFALASGVGLCLLGMGIALASTKAPERRGVIAQSVFRANMAVIGLPLATTLMGAEAAALTSVISAFVIALFNILAVIVLTVFLDDPEKRNRICLSKLLRDIATNPPVIAILLGFLCLLLRTLQTRLLGQPIVTLREDLPFLYSAVSQLRSVLTPFALLILGGQFSFSAIGGMRRELVVGTVSRLILAPLIGLSTTIFLNSAGILHCGPAEYAALIALFGSPVAVGSETMAGQMGNDAQLATQLVVWTSLLSIVTLFLIVCIMIAAGFLPV